MKKKQETGLSSACCLLHAGFLIGLLFNPEDIGNIPLQHQSTLNELHGVTFHKKRLTEVIDTRNI
jgi:hypothetical protein